MPAYTGFILQPTYRVRDGHAVVQLFGRLDGGPPFLVEDHRSRPYFFVRRGDRVRLAHEPGVHVEDTALRSLDGEPVVRVTVPVPAALPPLRDALADRGVPSYEADIRFPYRYLIDRGIQCAVAIEGEPEPADAQADAPLRRFRNPELAPAPPGPGKPSLRILSLDIETDPRGETLYSAAFFGEGVEEVHLVCPREVAGARSHPDERALLRAMVERTRALDPDVIVGWNVVDFDLRVWARRCEALGVPFEIGRVPDRVTFKQDLGFSRQWRAEVAGRMVLDGIPLVRDALRLEDYRLETVSRAVVGRGKRIGSEGLEAAAEITRRFREDPEALVDYNLEDARLALEVLEKEGLIELAVERSLLSGMQLDRVGASIASFDRVYLPPLRRHGFVAPNVGAGAKTELVQGGAVLDSQPGFAENVAVFDFKSLYPSLIRTFNLDPLAHALAARDPEASALLAPNGARFSREQAILPRIVESFMERREEARRRGAAHADQALKIMLNALFGVLGAGACRFFDPEVANAITGFGQQTLRWTRDAFEAEGVRVLYGDTDSVFVRLRAARPGALAHEEAEALRQRVESKIAARVRAQYDVVPRLTLELERVFDRFFLPHVRGGRGGSKKRYAGWSQGHLVVVGLESVRRDWPQVARRLQEGALERIFTGRDPLPFVREIARRVREGELDAELVYTKRVRKGSLRSYKGTTPPQHVQAALKAERAGAPSGPVVRYVITQAGPEPVLAGRPLPAGLDRAHYLDKVLRPVADAILLELGQSFDAALGRPTQLDLL
jgi:DNA polymerase II